MKNRRKKQSFVRVGIIGVGVMGKNHAKVYSQIDNVMLKAVADKSFSAIRKITLQYKVAAYLDYKKMIDKEKLDALSIAVPTKAHYEVAKYAIDKGLHVLVEKPLTAKIIEGERLIQLAERKDVILGVGHTERFNPVVSAIKRYLKKGILGKIFQISIRRIGPFPHRVKNVGVFLDLATHDIDVIYYLVESEVERFSAESSCVVHSSCEDLAVSILRFKNGIVGVLIENWLSPTKIRDIYINGENGMIMADFINQDVYYYKNNYTLSRWESLRAFPSTSEEGIIHFPIDRKEPLRVELEAFIASVRRERPFLVSGRDGLKAVAFAQELIQASSKIR